MQATPSHQPSLRPSVAMPPPQLPQELIMRILELATADLVDEERYPQVPGRPITNAFLLAASLVARTWRPVAQLLVLRYGLVTVPNFDLFLAQIRTRSVKLRSIRVGAGTQTSHLPGAALQRLLNALMPLKSLELVGNVLKWGGFDEVAWTRSRTPSESQIPTLILSNFYYIPLSPQTLNLAPFAPRRLLLRQGPPLPSIPRTPVFNDDDDGSFATIYAFATMYAPRMVEGMYSRRNFEQLDTVSYIDQLTQIKSIEHLDICIETGTLDLAADLLFDRSNTVTYTLKSLVLEAAKYSATSPTQLRAMSSSSNFPDLVHLRVHLAHLRSTLPSSIVTLEILPNLSIDVSEPLEAAHASIIRTADSLPALAKLTVPGCWKGEILEKYCGKMSVELVFS